MASFILYDCPGDPDFEEGLAEATGRKWIPKVADGRASVSKWRRMANYFLFPLIFLLTTRRIQSVVAWQQFYGVMTAVYARLMRRRFPITVMTFIYRPKSGIAGKLFHRLVKFGITSPSVKEIIVFSPGEVDDYARIFPEAAGKFRFCPLGIPLPSVKAGESASGSCIFSAGRSNRDYNILKQAAEEAGIGLRIACPEENAGGFSRTEILRDCFGEDMEREMATSLAVAIPLRDAAVSSGQLVALQAMSMGKAVVCSDNPALRPYIAEGKTAIVCRSGEEWVEALRRLSTDSALRIRLGEAGRERMLANFTMRNLGLAVGK